MRVSCLLVLLCLSGAAAADRIILAPNALKVWNRNARIEYMTEPTKSDNWRTFLAVGLTPNLEAELILNRLENRPTLGSFNASYQFIVPIVDTAPGVSVGVQDALDRTPERRMYYLAFTQRFGLDGPYNSQNPLEITAGFGFGRRSGVFVGAMIPFTWQFRLLAEHDLNRVAGGFEYQPFHGSAIRAIFQQGSTQLSFRYTFKF